MNNNHTKESDLKTAKNLNIGSHSLTGRETFSNGRYVSEFWSWAHSDLMNNVERGRLAEFIVSMALKCGKKPRVEWDEYDLITDTGVKVEVKSSAYLQTWKQQEYSKIRFGIAPTKVWSEKTHKYSLERFRRSDIYIFCLFTSKNPEMANPLDLGQWEFYVVKTKDLNNILKDHKSISLSTLYKIPHCKTDFENLGRIVMDIDNSN